MSRERVVKATFSNGTSIERGSVGRIYTHAWRVIGTLTEDARAAKSKAWGQQASATASESGFASSGENANRAMQSVKNNWLKSNSFASVSGEVAAVEVIDKRSKREAA